MSDPFASFAAGLESPGKSARVITPGASDFTPFAKAIVLLTAGNVTYIPVGNADGVPLAFVALPAGWVSPHRVRRVTAATATVATVDG